MFSSVTFDLTDAVCNRQLRNREQTKYVVLVYSLQGTPFLQRGPAEVGVPPSCLKVSALQMMRMMTWKIGFKDAHYCLLSIYI